MTYQAIPAVSHVLTFFTLLGACVWLGGFIAIGVVARSARATLERPAQVAFFRALGRSYGIVGSVALLIALGCGAALLTERSWDGAGLAAIIVACALVLATVAGVVQARGMTRLRRRAIEDDADERLAAQVRAGARRARILRSAIGLLSIALLALGVALIS